MSQMTLGNFDLAEPGQDEVGPGGVNVYNFITGLAVLVIAAIVGFSGWMLLFVR